jgi:hypothetical protein
MPELDDLAQTTDMSADSHDALEHSIRAELAASVVVLILTVAFLFLAAAALTGPDDERTEPLDPDAWVTAQPALAGADLAHGSRRGQG